MPPMNRGMLATSAPDLENTLSTPYKPTDKTKVAISEPRRPLGDRSNRKVVSVIDRLKTADVSHDKETMEGEVESVMEETGWYEVEGDLEGQLGELKTALSDALRENRRLHDEIRDLNERNNELCSKERELGVISMLYEAAKSEIDELTRKIHALSTVEDTDVKLNDDTQAEIVKVNNTKDTTLTLEQ